MYGIKVTMGLLENTYSGVAKGIWMLMEETISLQDLFKTLRKRLY